jgi:tetratricopeptide (TPR) repeat protein
LRAIEDALAIVADHDPLRRARLREKQGRATLIFGRIDECLEIWTEVINAYAELGECEAAGDLCWQTGYHNVWLNRFVEAFGIYARGLEIVGDQRLPVKADMLGSVGALIGFAGAYAEGTARLDEAMQLAAEFDDDKVLGHLFWGMDFVGWSFGMVPEACNAGRRAVEHLRAARDGWALIDALSWLSYPLACGGHMDEAERAAREALELSRKLGHRGGEILAARAVALVEGPRSGDLPLITEFIRSDLERCLSLDSPWSSMSYAWLANILTQRGEIDEALAHAAAAMRIEPASAWAGLGWASRIANRAYAGDRAEVESMLAAKLDELAQLSGPPAAMGSRHMLMNAGEAAALLGLRDAASALYPAIERQVDTVAMTAFDYLISQRVAGMVAAAIHDWERADEHLHRALEHAQNLPNRVDEPMVQYARGKMLLDRGDPADRPAAEELVRTAIGGFRRNGATLRERLAQQLLADA